MVGEETFSGISGKDDKSICRCQYSELDVEELQGSAVTSRVKVSQPMILVSCHRVG